MCSFSTGLRTPAGHSQNLGGRVGEKEPHTCPSQGATWGPQHGNSRENEAFAFPTRVEMVPLPQTLFTESQPQDFIKWQKQSSDYFARVNPALSYKRKKKRFTFHLARNPSGTQGPLASEAVVMALLSSSWR